LQCNRTAKRDVALLMAERIDGNDRVTLAGGEAYDTKGFVRQMRGMQVTPHVAQNHNPKRQRSGWSHHPPYRISD
jgi:hypothetical protein